jgi:hypothetical protein
MFSQRNPVLRCNGTRVVPKILLAVSILALAACSPEPRVVALPAAVDGGWKLKASGNVPDGEAPGKIPQLKPVQSLRGTYDGPTAIEAAVYRFKNNTGAFEALQSWRPDGQTIVRQKNDLFLTARSPQPDRSAVDTFLNGLEKAF